MKIPTLLGMVLLCLLVVGLSLATLYMQKLFAPQPSMSIKNIQTSNISDTSFSVTWFSTTPIPTLAYLGTYKNFSLMNVQPLHDDRDQQTPAKRITHLTTFKNIKPNQTYYV